MIKVLVVEDSPVTRDFLVDILRSDPGIEVIATASDGLEAVKIVQKEHPDLITMDIYMPGMNGLEATRKIMETSPTPIVIVSGNWDSREVETTFRAIEAGALSVVQKPKGIGHLDHEATAAELIKTVKLMSEVKVVKRWGHTITNREKVRPVLTAAGRDTDAEIRVVAIGASTGGPVALQTVLSGLPAGFPASVMIVQHMAEGFIQGMLDWLGKTSCVPLRIATDGETIMPGHAYFAPDGHHMGISGSGRIALSTEGPENGVRPSASHLFRSVANNFGRNAVGALLTGMGRDGADGLKLMRDKGALTIIQDRESSAVYGMPGAALELEAAMMVLSPDRIAVTLATMTARQRYRSGECRGR